jgi:hypothetical protein
MLPSGARKWTQALPLSSTPDSKSGPQLGGRFLDVVDQEAGDRAGGEVPIDLTLGPEDLDLAVVGELEHPEPCTVQLEPQAQDVTEEDDGRLGVVGPGAHPGQLDDPHGQTPTPTRARQAPRRHAWSRLHSWCAGATIVPP